MLTPRWYQQEAFDAVWDFLCQTRESNPLIELPTGAGKSLVIAMLAQKAADIDGRVLVLAHRKELLVQNGHKITEQIENKKSVGYYSAGLNKRNTNKRIVVCGIQSVHRRALNFGERNLVICDEAHLIPDNGKGMYRTFLTELSSANRNVRVVGLTATPYRTGTGTVAGPGKIFTQIVYSAPVRRLIDEGYLCRLTNQSDTLVHTDGLKIRNGEFVAREMEDAFTEGDKVEHACKRIVKETQRRQSVLIFCAGVHHAECVEHELSKSVRGEDCRVITGETPKIMREGTLERFKAGVFKYLINVDVLTTGFDAPNIDCIAVLRSTMSPGLFAQMVGRGFRTFDGKDDCLIMDFGENLQRHGPLDSPEYGRKTPRARGNGKGSGREGSEQTKICPNCEEEVAARGVLCENCGYRFPAKHDDKHDEESKILSEPETCVVEEITFNRHRGKEGKQDTLRVDYHTPDDFRPVSEWVCVEHEGFARGKAVAWWEEHSNSTFPDSINEAIDLWERGALRMPARIVTQQDGRWTRVIGREFEGERPEKWNEKSLAEMFADEEIPF